MPSRVNLADPDHEPTDQELTELSREAFAGVAVANESALRAIEEKIELESTKVLALVASWKQEVASRS